MRNKFFTYLFVTSITVIVGCSKSQDPNAVTTIESTPVALMKQEPPEKPKVLKIAPPPEHVEIVEEKTQEISPPQSIEEVMNSVNEGAPPIMPGSFESEDLTMRLREKMSKAYGGDISRVPEATIFLSNERLEDFISFYEERGYQVQRVSVPVTRILAPVLRDKPELSNQLQIENYEGVSINQAMIEGTGISAADRYIDPDTYEVIERLFITEMPLR